MLIFLKFFCIVSMFLKTWILERVESVLIKVKSQYQFMTQRVKGLDVSIILDICIIMNYSILHKNLIQNQCHIAWSHQYTSLSFGHTLLSIPFCNDNNKLSKYIPIKVTNTKTKHKTKYKTNKLSNFQTNLDAIYEWKHWYSTIVACAAHFKRGEGLRFCNSVEWKLMWENFVF